MWKKKKKIRAPLCNLSILLTDELIWLGFFFEWRKGRSLDGRGAWRIAIDEEIISLKFESWWVVIGDTEG